MCLKLSIFSKKQIATEDIIVYKYLDKIYEDANGELSSNASKTIFVTPFRNYKIEIGKTYEAELKCEMSLPFTKTCNIGLHSFKKCEPSDHLAWGDVICKCIIPKGSSYYKGKFFEDVSYASDKLTYVEIVKTF